VHFADSNRRAIGFGHTEMTSVAKALQDIGYSGYVSAEAFPWPDSDAAAAQTIQAFNHYFTK
jgi:sugar phosphate isomerase/epimerase